MNGTKVTAPEWENIGTDPNCAAYQENRRVFSEEVPKGKPTHSIQETWRKPQAENKTDTPPVSDILSKIGSVWDYEPEPTEYICEPLVALSGVSLLASPEGGFKTWNALAVAKAVAHGGELFGRECKPRPVIYCDRENHVSLIRQRIDDLGFAQTPNFIYWHLGSKIGPPPMLENVNFYVELIESVTPRPLLIFDSLVRFHSAENENSSADMAPVMASPRTMATAGAGVLLLHHRGKSAENNYRGSSDIGAGVDIAMRMIQETEGALTLKSSKTRYGPPWEITLKFDLACGGFETISNPGLQKAKAEFSEIAEHIRTHPGTSKDEVEKAFKGKLSQRRVREILVAGAMRHDWKIKIGEHGRKELFPTDTPRQIDSEIEF
jgi:hypothetical protein